MALHPLGRAAVLGLLLQALACTTNTSSPPPAPPRDAGTIDAGPKPDAGAADGGPGDAGNVNLTDATVGGLAAAAGGNYSKSANYQMVWTLGEGPGNNASSASSAHKATWGVAGATQAK